MSREESGLRGAMPGIAALIGIVLVAGGLLLPAMSNPASAITEEQAEEYYSASRAMEEAAAGKSQRNRQAVPPSSAEEARALQAARDRFAAAREQVDVTKRGKESLAWWMKVGGFVFVALGVGGLLMQKSGG